MRNEMTIIFISLLIIWFAVCLLVGVITFSVDDREMEHFALRHVAL